MRVIPGGPRTGARRRWRRALAAAIALSWMAPAAAAAQPFDEETSETAAGGLTWNPSAALTTLGYDSNVLNDYEDPKSDFVAAVRTGLRPSWHAGPAVVEGEAALEYDYYATFARERGVDAIGRGRVSLPLSRFRLHAAGAYYNVKERFNNEVDDRARHSTREASAGVDIALGALTALTLTGVQRGISFDEHSPDEARLGQMLDRMERAVSAGLRYELTPLTTLTAAVSHGTHRFQFSPDRDGERTSVDTTVELADDALVGGHGTIAWRRVTVHNPIVPPFRGFAGSAGLSARLGGSTRVGVGARRDVTFSVGEVLPYYVESAVGGSVGRALGERFDLGFRVERVRLEYVRLLDALDPGGYHERVTILGGSIGYRTPSGLQITFHVDSRRRRTSTDVTRNFDSLRFYTAIGPVLSF